MRPEDRISNLLEIADDHWDDRMVDPDAVTLENADKVSMLLLGMFAAPTDQQNAVAENIAENILAFRRYRNMKGSIEHEGNITSMSDGELARETVSELSDFFAYVDEAVRRGKTDVVAFLLSVFVVPAVPSD
jgi:hypothetical protein